MIVKRLRDAGCVYAEDEAALLTEAATSPRHLETLVSRRIAGHPLETLLGWAEFLGHRILLDPGVFVPRRRTEHLANTAAALLHPPATVIDLCCGSGALAAVLTRDGIDVHATDIDPTAVTCARRNLDPTHVHQGDLYQPLPEALRGRVDVIVANAPYVPTDAIATMPPEARDHEPRVALDGGADGLTIARRVTAQAPQWLRDGGHLIIETSTAQAPHLADIMHTHGLNPHITSDDELDGTAVIGTHNARKQRVPRTGTPH